MDVREKLVEILKQAPFEGKVLDEWWWEEKIVRIVDHLIAHGVTVQEWISVKERLPENNRPVLVYLKNYTIQGGYVVHIGSYDTAGFWFLRTQPGIASFPVREWVVTHWMPLPEAPKGDK